MYDIRRYALPAFLITCVTMLFVTQEIVYGVTLPNLVPSHWTNGVPDSYSPKGTLIGIFCGVYVGASLLLFSFVVGVPYCPHYVLRMPNKDYWFNPAHPERAKYALQFLSAWYCYFLAWIEIFLTSVFEVVLEAARTGIVSFYFIYIPVAIYILGILGMIVWLIRVLSGTINDAESEPLH